MTTQILPGGTNHSLDNANTEYNCIMGSGDTSSTAWNATEANREQVLPTAGTFKNLRVRIHVAPGAGKSYAFTFRKNGAATGLTVTISDTDTEGSDLVNSVSVVAGDQVALECVPSGTPATSMAAFSTVWEGTNAKESILMGVVIGAALATRYGPLHGGYAGAAVATEWDAETMILTGGTIKSLYCRNIPGWAFGSRTYTVRKNQGDTAIACTISGAGPACNDTVDSVTVVDGDEISIKITYVSAFINQGNAHAFSVVFETTDDEQFLIEANFSFSGTSLSRDVATGYSTGAPPDVGGIGQRTQACTLTKMRMAVDSAPGAGNWIKSTLRVEPIATDFVVTISDTDTEGELTGQPVMLDDDRVRNHVQANVSMSRQVRVCYLATAVRRPVPGPALGSANVGIY